MISLVDPALGEAEIDAAVARMREGALADGREVREFEAEFAAFCGAEHAVATCNGTTALHAALEALDLGDGDRVVTTPFSFVASANAVRLAGAEPVFADVDPETYNLDPTAVERAIERAGGVDAVLAVHLYGLPAEMARLREIADAHGVPLIEDAAQAHGAEYRGQRAGSLGDVACFSFYPTKNMTTGEGGMITTDRADVAERAAAFVNHGRGGDGRYAHADVGHNFRMTSIAAAIGREQLDRLPAYNEARREHAAALTDGLAAVPVATPTEPAGRRHVYHQYTIRTENRDGLRRHLEDAGIGTGVYYPTPIHEQPAYRDVSHRAPVAERAAEEVLSLPVHPGLSRGDVRTISTTVSNYES